MNSIEIGFNVAVDPGILTHEDYVASLFQTVKHELLKKMESHAIEAIKEVTMKASYVTFTGMPGMWEVEVTGSPATRRKVEP